MILDASVAIKWLLKGEEYEKEALFILKNHIAKRNVITVPTFFFLEIANALATKSGLSDLQIQKSIDILYQTDVQEYKPNKQNVLESARLAKLHNTSVYDMLYAVIAKQEKSTLITADNTFIRKTGFSFVKHVKSVLKDDTFRYIHN